MNKILVTGGAGYIGSHTVLQLLEAGRQVVVFDNLSNSKPEALRRVRALAAQSLGMPAQAVPLQFVQGDIRDARALEALFAEHQDISSVIHFAGLKAVGESLTQPLRYYDNNVNGSIQLLQAMLQAGVFSLVFSSSATVYGDPHQVPIREDFPLQTTNPYGASKLHVEDMLRDVHAAEPEVWRIAILRYFNPVGAHSSGQLDDSSPMLNDVDMGDYTHVQDLARGHLQALDRLAVGGASGNLVVVNLGTGHVANCYVDPSLALEELGWEAILDVSAMCQEIGTNKAP